MRQWGQQKRRWRKENMPAHLPIFWGAPFTVIAFVGCCCCCCCRRCCCCVVVLCSCCLLFQTSPILLRPAASSTSSTWRPRAKDVCICMYIYICVCVCSRLLFVLPMGVFPAPLLILYARCPFWATVTSAAPSLVVVPFGSSTRMWMWNSLD